MNKILFIDDEKALVDMYHYIFEKNGYKFITTFDIQEALKMTELEKPDIILLDIIIPKSGNAVAEQGYDYLKKVKSNSKTKDIPVIVFSNLDTPQDRKRYKEMGAFAFIFKRDCSPKEVLDFINQILGQLNKK